MNNDFYKELGKNIKKEREKQGLTQQQLADTVKSNPLAIFISISKEGLEYATSILPK